MDHVAAAWETDKPMTVGNTENDDPSLLLLFQHLKSKSLQTAKGTSEIHEKTEFDFVLHNARVFFRMGEPTFICAPCKASAETADDQAAIRSA